MSVDYKLQHKLHVSDFFVQLDTLSTKGDLHRTWIFYFVSGTG